MQDEELYKMMKIEKPYLADQGFSDQVMEKLPLRNRFRILIISSSFIVATLIAAGIWMLGSEWKAFDPLSLPMLFSAASLAFWSFVALFAFVSVDEGVFEL